ncbi:root hair defective 3 GTP-binding protein-domain-containing protein [Mycena pura]|uniref:Root hair defective 3 GTP-binding protein-domain-containing protein n=1 Tax=Mycena pura TaxID=153505 RepID=A0AAD6YL74_9AGAR|nr:root hair defective 3 GTP-binding protein-domain-containing protein [Mycena pura]
MSHLKAGEYRIILYSDNSFVSVEAGNEEHLTVQVDAPDPAISIEIQNEWTIKPGAKDGQYYIKNKMHNSYAVWKPHYESDEVTSASNATLDDDAMSLWEIVPENDGLHRICPATNGTDRCWSVEDSMLGRIIVLSMPSKEGTALWQFQQVGGQQSDETSCGCCRCRCERMRNNNDLNLPTLQELIAEYRCNEISTIALAEFNERAKSSVLEADRRQMMLRNWRTAALARYDRDASRYHQGVYKRIRTNLIASLDATLFLGHLRKLRKTYLLTFKKDVLGGLHGEGFSFADVVSKARERCLWCFETGAKEVMAEGQDWIWEDEMISLKEEAESIAAQCKKDETKKMVNLIERHFKKQISEPVELALDKAASDMWDDILRRYKQTLVESEAQYWAKATSFDCTEEEKVTSLAVLRRRAWQGLRAKIDEQTAEPVILGKLCEHFEKRFQRVWKPEDDIDGVFKEARDETLGLIRLYSRIQPLDPLLKYELPADSIALPTDSLSDEDFDFAATLVVITKPRGVELTQKFRREADAYCAEAKRSRQPYAPQPSECCCRHEQVRNNNDLNLPMQIPDVRRARGGGAQQLFYGMATEDREQGPAAGGGASPGAFRWGHMKQEDGHFFERRQWAAQFRIDRLDCRFLEILAGKLTLLDAILDIGDHVATLVAANEPPATRPPQRNRLAPPVPAQPKQNELVVALDKASDLLTLPIPEIKARVEAAAATVSAPPPTPIFTVDNVLGPIPKLSPWKAPGPSGIPNVAIMVTVAPFLLNALEAGLNCGYFPKS